MEDIKNLLDEVWRNRTFEKSAIKEGSPLTHYKKEDLGIVAAKADLEAPKGLYKVLRDRYYKLMRRKLLKIILLWINKYKNSKVGA